MDFPVVIKGKEYRFTGKEKLTLKVANGSQSVLFIATPSGLLKRNLGNQRVRYN